MNIDAIYCSDHDDFSIDVDFADGSFLSFTGDVPGLVGILVHHDTGSNTLDIDTEMVQALFPIDSERTLIGLSDRTSIEVPGTVQEVWNRFATTHKRRIN